MNLINCDNVIMKAISKLLIQVYTHYYNDSVSQSKAVWHKDLHTDSSHSSYSTAKRDPNGSHGLRGGIPGDIYSTKY
jgi:hypothetical protein